MLPPDPASITHQKPALPVRDRVAIITALAGVTALAWVYLVHMAMRMDVMMDTEMPGMSMMTGVRAWSVGDFVIMLLMWVVMMIGMMVPTAIPMTLIYAAVARKADGEGAPIAPTAMFVSGYIVMWSLFSVAATTAQWGLDQTALLSPMMVTTSPAVGAAILIVAGVYQLTPFKHACLKHCRSPAHFIAGHWRDGAAGAFRMGAEHGLFCIGCCWALMGLLFFGGVMSLFWIIAITVFVLLEKVIPFGVRGGQIAGIGMIVFGVVFLIISRA